MTPHGGEWSASEELLVGAVRSTSPTISLVHPVVEIQQPDQASLFVSIRGPLVIGRECDGLLIADPQVSRRHLSLDVVAGEVVVSDLGSTNGSTIDGRPLTAPEPLLAGCVVRCGETTIALESAGASRSGGPAAAGVADDASSLTSADEHVRASPTDRFVEMERPRYSSSIGRSSIEMVAARAQHDGVDVRSLRSERGTVTIVFSDIEASAERSAVLGEQAWFDVLDVHDAIVERRVAQHDGTIVAHHGDGFMLWFASARSALDAMMAVQRDLVRGSQAAPDRSVRVRVGMHTGQVSADDDEDRFGRHVIVAARIADLSAGSEILVSPSTRDIISREGGVEFGGPRPVTVKGFGDAIVHPVEWVLH